MVFVMGGDRSGSKGIVVPIATVRLSDEQRKNVLAALDANWIGFNGPFTREFEREFARLCDRAHAVFVASGSAALHLALLALDVGVGDEVICPDFTIISVPHAISLCGARPVFVDVDGNGNIVPDLIEEKITANTKAVIVVHSFGIPAEIERVLEIARRHGLCVVEDCSQAHGARYCGKVVGSFGDVACFSLYTNKLIMTAEGGMVVTSDDAVAERVRRARNMYYSDEERFYHERFGWNYRATDLQAAIGLPLCRELGDIIRRRRGIAGRIRDGLRGIEWIEFMEPPDHVDAVDWVFCVKLKRDAPLDRRGLMRRLADYGVDSRPLFVPFHMQPMYKADGEFPGAVDLFERGLYVSCHHELENWQVDRIIEAFWRAFGMDVR